MDKEKLLQELIAKLKTATRWTVKKSLSYQKCMTRKGEQEQAGILTEGAIIRPFPITAECISDDGLTVFINATGIYGERYISIAVPIPNISDHIASFEEQTDNWSGNDT